LSAWANASGVLSAMTPPPEDSISGQVSVPFVVSTVVAAASASKKTKPKFSWLVGSAKTSQALKRAIFSWPEAKPRK